MSQERKGFIVYGDIEAVISELDDKQVAKLFRGMLKYFNDGTDPKFTGILKFVFIPIKQQMDRDQEKYSRRCEKNRENVRKRWEQKLYTIDTNVYDRIRNIQTYTIDTNTNTNTNTNTKTNTKTNKDTNTNTKAPESAGIDSPFSPSPFSLSIFSFLNERTGSCFEVTESDEERLNRILEGGYSSEDIKAVIDFKAAEWMDSDKMRRYLRPRTLFGPKFVDYVRGARSNGFLEERERRAAAAETNRARDEAVRAMEEERPASGLTEEEKEELRKRFGAVLDRQRMG